MEPIDAERALQGIELVPAVEGSLDAARQTVYACLEADIPALVGKAEGCGKSGCDSGACGCGASHRGQVLVREGDVPRVREMLMSEWQEALKKEGLELPVPVGAVEAAEGSEPPCPACGTAAPLVDGACSDCGLQLE